MNAAAIRPRVSTCRAPLRALAGEQRLALDEGQRVATAAWCACSIVRGDLRRGDRPQRGDRLHRGERQVEPGHRRLPGPGVASLARPTVPVHSRARVRDPARTTLPTSLRAAANTAERCRPPSLVMESEAARRETSPLNSSTCELS